MRIKCIQKFSYITLNLSKRCEICKEASKNDNITELSADVVQELDPLNQSFTSNTSSVIGEPASQHVLSRMRFEKKYVWGPHITDQVAVPAYTRKYLILIKRCRILQIYQLLLKFGTLFCKCSQICTLIFNIFFNIKSLPK